MNDIEKIIKILQTIGCKISFTEQEINFSDKTIVSNLLLNKIHTHDEELKRHITDNITTMSLSTDRGLVGTSLRRLLPTEWSLCNKFSELDARGYEWCENNMNTILLWLYNLSIENNLSFDKRAAKILLKKAISDAKKSLIGF